MNKFFFSLFAVFILNILPFFFYPELLLHYKTVILVVAAFCIWLTQPAFSIKETKENSEKDKFSILLILAAASTSIVSANIEWANTYPEFENRVTVTIIGFTMIFIGIIIRVWAIRTLGKYFTATVILQHQQTLITKGPYRFIRHPSYLGAFLSIVGCAVFLNAYWSIALAFIFMGASYIVRIRVEERALVRFFGNDYREYSKKTWRIFPLIW
ncbi:MAG: isoprenylcysteine carboxylmethyltransferase family protein [Bacteroidetes bacterium]|nr:isoprenylcysteine carboxylmethyltransferase family protein [Bacteroidota bacterium]